MTTPISSSTQTPNIKVIYAGRLIDALTDQVRTNVSVIIENDRISEVQPGKAVITGAETIDLSDSTVLPGLIDCHTHLTFQLEKGRTLKDLLLSRKADLAIGATIYARRTLLAGFTTVRDVGAPDFIDVSLRDAIRAGTVSGPRMYVATYLLTITGGHGDFSSGLREELLPEPDFRRGIVNSPEDGVRAVRYMIKYGADHIKIVSTGGVLSLGDTQAGEQLTFAEMRAIVETAHQLDRKVEAHAHGAAGIKDALRAGVDSIEHGTYLDDEAIALFEQQGAYLVPTISAGKWTEAKAKEPGYYPPAIAAKAMSLGTLIQKAFAKAYHQDVKIAFGTDAGVYPHGQNAQEFQYMVEAGMSPMEAILTATRNAANLLGQSANIGTIQPGRYADLVAVKGNPLADIKLLQNISFVMKEGRIYKRDGIVLSQ
ncbi:MAG TPA: amidohydrolase family protein [Pyrinomonadaceae bacterium]|nr:amidohydrolase family protein [Pyrinomonadaceae bacterium]